MNQILQVSKTFSPFFPPHTSHVSNIHDTFLRYERELFGQRYLVTHLLVVQSSIAFPLHSSLTYHCYEKNTDRSGSVYYRIINIKI